MESVLLSISRNALDFVLSHKFKAFSYKVIQSCSPLKYGILNSESVSQRNYNRQRIEKLGTLKRLADFLPRCALLALLDLHANHILIVLLKVLLAKRLSHRGSGNLILSAGVPMGLVNHDAFLFYVEDSMPIAVHARSVGAYECGFPNGAGEQAKQFRAEHDSIKRLRLAIGFMVSLGRVGGAKFKSKGAEFLSGGKSGILCLAQGSSLFLRKIFSRFEIG
jgi:hypothetical protein